MAHYNLPGFYTIYKESGQVVSTPGDVGDTVTLLGTATDGPSWTQVTIGRREDAQALFGAYVGDDKKYNGATLVRGFNECYDAGCRSIKLVRLGGKYATATISTAEATPTVIVTLRGKYPGSKYNNVKYRVTDTSLDLWSVQDATLGKTTPTAQYSLSSYSSMAALVDAVNNQTELHDCVLETNSPDAPVDNLVVMTQPATLSGGDDQLDLPLGSYDDDFASTPSLRGALKYMYDLLLDQDTDVIVPLGVYVKYNTSTSSYDKTDLTALAEFVYKACSNNHEMTGVIAYEPVEDTSLAALKTLVTKLSGDSVSNQVICDGVDAGRYVSVVIAEPIFNDVYLGLYSAPAAAAYAGLYSTLRPESGSTNKVLPNAVGLKYEFGLAQHEALSSKKFVTLRTKSRGVVVNEGLICSSDDSDYQQLSTVRVVHKVVKAIRNVVDPYIGEPLDLPHVSSLDTAIRGVLNTFVKSNALVTGTFSMYFDNTKATIGDLNIELDLVIAPELRRVIVTVSRRFSA